jgi:glutamate N-acetyltransferase / amino-acid N-acetyltransferase
MTIPLSGVRGFRVGAVDAGLYAFFGKASRPDLTLIVADGPCVAAGLFTTNLVKAAPVLYDSALLGNAARAANLRAVLVNTASANACTGNVGLSNAEQCAHWAAEAIGCGPEQILLMSTGVIGTQLPMPQIEQGIGRAITALGITDDAWAQAGRAIMTTDTRPKLASAGGPNFQITGMAKGAGMIAPNMATMLSVLVTDAKISQAGLQTALAKAVEVSFNCISIDGDMSTNDTVLALASGVGAAVEETPDLLAAFTNALTEVCQQLAHAIVRDGEGATKFIEIHVEGALSKADAHKIANTIATSPLVKTAFYGGDPNWGRILAAAGRAGVWLAQRKTDLWYGDLQLVAEGTPLAYDEARAKYLASQPEIVVRLVLGLGEASSTVWTCDLSHEYVNVNGHYRT